MSKCRDCKHNGFLVEDGEQFSWCEVAADNLDIDEERDCAGFIRATNGDWLRAMMDEKLAEWIANRCPECPPGQRPAPVGCDDVCAECWLDWLQQETMNECR